ncbi:MAG: beta-glucosidase [Proteobacteria bacterium]|nr:beta-glucosidase [Pseudomonadota bacterium]
MSYPQFPKNFLFGTATAAYQIEGGWNADGKGLSIWDTFCRTPGKIHGGESGEIACNTYHDFHTDIDLMSALGLNAYRFSIAWPRIQPQGFGEVNRKGLDYYSRLVDALLQKGITPFVTLFHWDLPQALYDYYRGFGGRETANYFADYAEIVVRRLGDRVKYWITLNEPWEHAALGYFLGEHAPGERNPRAYFCVAHHQLLGHGMAVERVRGLVPDAKIGIALSQHLIHARTNSDTDRQAAAIADQFMNTWYLDALYRGAYPEPLWSRARWLRPQVYPGDLELISQPTDFLGINYYSRNFARHAWYIPFLHAWIDGDLTAEKEFVDEGRQYTSMGWEVYPQGIYDVITRLKNEYDNPVIYITENGAAFTDLLVDGRVHDPLRRSFLDQYMRKTANAISDGADVRGYFIWSLMDNFEWATGYSKRFGLIYVDHTTQERTTKDSGYWVREMITAQS